jgi:hypothetical protein
MSFVVRIRSWRTRRKERRDEQLIAQAAVSPEARPPTLATARKNLDARLGYAQPSHAGEEGKKHY